MVDNLLQNLSQSLPPEMVERVQNNYFQASLDTASMGGDLFAIPLYVDFPAMLYRKDLVMEAGYDPSDWATEPMSWKRFSEVTRDVQTQTDTTYGFTFQAQNYEGLACCTFNEFMTSMGGAYFGDHENLFGPVGDRPITVDDESVLKAIKLVRTFIANDSDDNTLDGYASGITPGDVLTWAEIPSFEPFANGNAVMHRNWPFVIPKAAKPESEGGFGTDVGMMPMPYGVTESAAAFEGAGGSASALGGWHVAMNPNSTPTQKQAAVQVLKAMLTEQFQLEAFTIAGWSPPNSKRFNSEKARDVPIVGRYLDTLLVAGEHAVPRPVTKVWSKESDQIASRVHAALSGKASPEEAMARLKSSLKQIENGQ
jgi:ABC-type glycerol-3-phosphate transport system substrate-binding protein